MEGGDEAFLSPIRLIIWEGEVALLERTKEQDP